MQSIGVRCFVSSLSELQILKSEIFIDNSDSGCNSRRASSFSDSVSSVLSEENVER